MSSSERMPASVVVSPLLSEVPICSQCDDVTSNLKRKKKESTHHHAHYFKCLSRSPHFVQVFYFIISSNMCSYIPILTSSEFSSFPLADSTVPKDGKHLHFRERPQENSIKRKRAFSTSSEPIKCPKSSYIDESDSLQSYHRDVRYYDSLTWAMYHRITQARRKRKNGNDITNQKASVLESNTDSSRVFDNDSPSEYKSNTLQNVEDDIFPLDM